MYVVKMDLFIREYGHGIKYVLFIASQPSRIFRRRNKGLLSRTVNNKYIKLRDFVLKYYIKI